MPRSPGFGSNASNSVALLRLAFAAPTPNGLSLLDTLSHRPIMQEVRCHPSRGLQLLVSIRFQVLFHSPHRGAFHLSLTVLCSLSVMYEYLGLEGGPPTFRQDFTSPALLKSFSIAFAYGAITRSGPSFHSVLLAEEKALAWSAFARYYSRNLG